MTKTSRRNKDIAIAVLKGATYRKVAVQYDITRERASQITRKLCLHVLGTAKQDIKEFRNRDSEITPKIEAIPEAEPIGHRRFIWKDGRWYPVLLEQGVGLMKQCYLCEANGDIEEKIDGFLVYCTGPCGPYIITQEARADITQSYMRQQSAIDRVKALRQQDRGRLIRVRHDSVSFVS